MPQLDITTFPSQIFWLIVCFSVLCFAMASFLVPRIGSSLANRQKVLTDLRDSADQLVRDADQLEEENKKNMKDVRSDVNQRIHQAITDMNHLKNQRLSEFEEAMQVKLKALQTTLTDQKCDLLKNTDQLVTYLSSEAYTRLSGRKIEERVIAQSVSSVEKYKLQNTIKGPKG